MAAEMEFAARRAGRRGACRFPTIIAAGKRSALPHGRASKARSRREGSWSATSVLYSRAIVRTGPVPCTSGVLRAKRAAFMRRCGKRKLAAIEAVRPGVSVGEVDQAARNVLETTGLARYFTHSTGHGVGLEIHEAPRVAAGQNEILASGNGDHDRARCVYPGQWGVRIEDWSSSGKRGCEVLAPRDKELITI